MSQVVESTADRPRRVVFTEQFYYPDGWGGAQIPRDITAHLAQQGFEVEVVCGSEPYAPVEDPGLDPTSYGVRIARLPRLLPGDIHSFKLIRQLWFYLLAMPALLLRRRPALYIAQTNPPLLVPIVASVALLRRVPLLIIAQDLYPEVVVAHGMMSKDSLGARILRSLFSWAYRRAARVVSLGPKMTDRLREKGVEPGKICVISNWATGSESVVRGEANQLRQRWQLAGKFVVLYSGNIGIAHDIETPILAIERAIQSRPEMRLVIIGKGSRLQEARALVKQRGLEPYVQFEPLVPAEMLPHSIGLADVALVTLLPGFEGLVVPSKLLGYMARGIPTAYVGPRSDVTAMIEQSQGGLCFTGSSVEQLAAGLVRLAEHPEDLARMGQSAARYYEDSLGQTIALQRYRDLVMSLIQRSSER